VTISRMAAFAQFAAVKSVTVWFGLRHKSVPLTRRAQA
jgi:hypothetical protein